MTDRRWSQYSFDLTLVSRLITQLWLWLWPQSTQQQRWPKHPPHTRLKSLPFLPHPWCSPHHPSLTVLLCTYQPCITSSTRGMGKHQWTRRKMGMAHLPPPGRNPGEIGIHWIWWKILLCFWDLWLSALCLWMNESMIPPPPSPISRGVYYLCW